MSTPSTPRSTHSARSTAPADGSPNIMTPGQKIKAMMAQFDSDSESDSRPTTFKPSLTKPAFGSKNTSIGHITLDQPGSSEDDSDDTDIVKPKGRMAARMQDDASLSTNPASSQHDFTFSRFSKSLLPEREPMPRVAQSSPAPADVTSEDDLPAAPRRRNLTRNTQSPDPADHASPHRSALQRSASPLFVSPQASPQKNAPTSDQINDNDSLNNPKSNARFLALVAQKRKEREERERIEQEKQAARRAQLEHFSSEIMSGDESDQEGDGSARNLSQNPRKPRKASKKALEEMRQETQRISRNMQLAHQAQTKKKITKESLFARFNFMQPTPSSAEPTTTNSSSAAGSQHSSDGDSPGKDKETPRTSPVPSSTDANKPVTLDVHEATHATDEHPINQSTTQACAKEEDLVSSTLSGSKENTLSAKKVPFKPTQRPVRVLLSRQEVARHQREDSDSDGLEVVTSPSKTRRIAVFENLPTKKLQESSSLMTLKALAHLTSPSRKHNGMNSAELSASLLYRARQQAAKERRERIEELRAKGIVIETAEERAAIEDDIEIMMEKARQEAEEIARKEKDAHKSGKSLNDNNDDDDDDDYYALSGSDEDESLGDSDQNDEEEEDDDDEVQEDDEDLNQQSGFFEDEADEDDDSADEKVEDTLSDADELIRIPSSRRKRSDRVVNDDEEDEPQVPSTPVRPASLDAQSLQRPVFPGMAMSNETSMGLTQAFAGTLADDNESASQPASSGAPFSLPDPGPPVPRVRAENSEILVHDSQEQPEETNFTPTYSQNVTRVSESPAAHKFSQFSQLPDPTQDQGFVYSPFDPAKRFRETPPASTVDTVLIGQTQSPLVDRKSRQLRRGRAAHLSNAGEDENEGDFEVDANAFNVMKKAAKKASVPYDKMNSEAKKIVDEAAEESEDEYAGLGGASDDSEGEEDAYDQQMINDQSGEVVDEKQLAAMNAKHQRERDEKDVAKLYKDITTGALRRRRGGDDEFDLDDSDDELLARRREKQREFAKMRRALLADDKIGQLADDPKKAAFFKAIEDREDDDDFELDFLEDKPGDSQNEASQDTAQEQNDPAEDSKKRKRPLEPSAEDVNNRPPPHLRRTRASAMSKKPATLAEIRETLSFLTETPEYDSFHEDASVDEDERVEDEADPTGIDEALSEDAGAQSKNGFAVPSHPRRTRGVVVDRLALLRQASSNSASATTSGSSANTKFAFHRGSTSDAPVGFRPPQLLRRMNTSSSSSSSSTTSSSANRVSQPPPSGPKKGGAINSYTAAREKEREKQLRMKQRGGGANIAKLLGKHAGYGLGALAGKGQWD